MLKYLKISFDKNNIDALDLLIPIKLNKKMCFMFKYNFLMVSLVVIALCACSNRSEKIRNLEDIIVPTHITSAGENVVRTCIIRGAEKRKWTCMESGYNKLVCQNLTRTHSAEIAINYTPTSYSIKYLNSTNLNENDGLIHRKYNLWIQKLNNEIRKEMLVYKK